MTDFHKFQNGLKQLQYCYDSLDELAPSPVELDAREDLITLCAKITNEYNKISYGDIEAFERRMKNEMDP